MNAAVEMRMVEEIQAPAKRKREKKFKNITLRENGMWYFTATIEGRRYFESLDTRDREVAAGRARAKREAIKGKKWDSLDSTRVKRQIATIGEICSAYETMMLDSGRIRTITCQTNVATLLRMVSAVENTENPRAVSSSVLTGKFAKRYAAILAPEGGGSKDGENRIRRTIASNLVHARSMVRRKLWEDFKHAGIQLPDLSSFLDQFVTKNPKLRYEMPPKELYEPTVKAGRALTGNMALVWLMAYDLGMRAGEITAAKWDWIEKEDTPKGPRYWMVVKERPDFTPKGISGKIPIFDGVYVKLMAHQKPGDTFILTADHATDREDLTKREFSKWMRDLGWTSQKCAHELRKLRGCWWFSRFGMERTYKWLRHANMQTTLDHYADLAIQDEPLMIETPSLQWDDMLRK
jgi:integrase